MPKKGFTLIEILVVIVIAGVVITAAMAPMVLTIRNLRYTEEVFGVREAMWKSLTFMGRDLRQSLPGPEGAAFRLSRGERDGSRPDDVVCFWSSSILSSGMSPGTVIYRIISDKTELPGLYRIFYPSRAVSGIDCRDIPETGLQIIIPSADGFRVSVWDGETWVEEYEGPRPAAIRITLERRGEVVEYVDWIPR